MGTKVYNNLPKFLKEIDDYKAFKKGLKLFLLLSDLPTVCIGLVIILYIKMNHVLADDSCAFLLQGCCVLGNANDTLGREQNPCVYNSEPYQVGRQ
jgi:hypothetical protein